MSEVAAPAFAGALASVRRCVRWRPWGPWRRRERITALGGGTERDARSKRRASSFAVGTVHAQRRNSSGPSWRLRLTMCPPLRAVKTASSLAMITKVPGCPSKTAGSPLKLIGFQKLPSNVNGRGQAAVRHVVLVGASGDQAGDRDRRQRYCSWAHSQNRTTCLGLGGNRGHALRL